MVALIADERAMHEITAPKLLELNHSKSDKFKPSLNHNRSDESRSRK
jgi:hypothetical protein